MNKGFFFRGLFILSILAGTLYSYNLKNAQAASFRDGNTLVLYDATSQAIPGETLMDFTDFPPGAASLTYSDNVAVLDTSSSGMDTFAGWVSGQAITTKFPVLDRTVGFQVNFIVQVESESHTKNNRAGFSVILLDREAKGIELAFWENEIWAQNDDRTGSLFSHGEGVTFATTGLTEYQVSVVGDTYTLLVNSEQILTGPVRDYSKFDGFPDPYETPNFLFFGDDTTTAQAQVKLRFASVTGTMAVPSPVTMTGTSRVNLLPTASSTPPLRVTAVSPATPTPGGKVIQLCSSGWLLFAAVSTSFVRNKKVRRSKNSF